MGANSARLAHLGADPDLWASGRRRYLDNLKVLLIAAIIAGHAVAGYADLNWWPYAEMREVSLAPVTQTIMFATLAPATLMLIPTLFLVAGLLTPGSLQRKGAGAFARDRLVRLGVPFAVYVLIVQPVLMYPVHPPGQAPRPYWVEFVRGDEWGLDSGPLWFVGVLLIFSLAYAGWQRWRPDAERVARPVPLSVRRLLFIVAAIAAATFCVRLVIPLGTLNAGVNLNLWEWPACLALFGLGIAAGRQRWLDEVPDRIRRGCRAITLGALGGFAVLGILLAVLELPEDQLWGGWGWPALVFAVLDSTLAVCGAVWVFAAAQRHLDRPFRLAPPAVVRSAYAAFIVQVVVLLGLAVALSPVPLPAEIKAVVVAVGGVIGSFGLAWLLLRSSPGLRRIL